MKITKLFFKPTIPVEIEEIKEELEKAFPQYEYSLWGKIGKKGLKVKKSTFRGARIIQAAGLIWIRKTPPTFIGALIDAFSLKLIRIVNNKTVRELSDFLREKYE